MLHLLTLWERARALLGPPNVTWCEERLAAIIEEPANTWSNLAYILAALLVFLMRKSMRKSVRKSMRKPKDRLGPFAHAVLWMGLFSFIYHASNNALTQWFDFLGMFFYTGYLLTWNAARLNKIRDGQWLYFWGTTLVVNFVFLFALTFAQFPIQAIIGGNILIIFASEFVLYRRARARGTRTSYGDYLLAMLFMLIASVFSVLDVRRVWCDPQDHILQGHALWHVMSAIGVVFTARFYKALEPGD